MKNCKFPGFDAPIDKELWKRKVQIPDQLFSIDGGIFVAVDLEFMCIPSDEQGEVSVRLLSKLASFTDQTRLAAASILIHSLDGNRKTASPVRWLDELSLFMRSISELLGGRKISTITTGMFDWYAGQKGASQIKLLRSTLLYWISRGVPGIQRELVTHLESTSPKAPRGMIEVQNAVPSERPFTTPQITALLRAIGQLYVTQAFNPQENFLWKSMISEALRPSQLRLLQFGDFQIDRDTEGKAASVRLFAPMVKQKGTPARSFKTEHRLSHSLSVAFLDHRKFVAEILGSDPPETLPVFCVKRGLSADQPPFIDPKGIGISHLVSRTRILIVEIAGEFEATDLFNRRFKHTKLSNLAAAGASDEVLAHAGYQTSTISLRRYVNLTDEAFSAIEEMLDDTHQSIDDAFRGTVIDPDDAKFKDPEHLVMDPSLEDPVGACSADPCGVLACLGCYICPRFQAFTDGPHKRVEAVVLEQQERARAAGLTPEAIYKNAPILAGIRSVIRLIEEK